VLILCRCPYISRELHKVVDLLFAPYNYLIDRGNEKSLTIVWDNNRLIFDEGHNHIRGQSSSFFFCTDSHLTIY